MNNTWKDIGVKTVLTSDSSICNYFFTKFTKKRLEKEEIPLKMMMFCVIIYRAIKRKALFIDAMLNCRL